MRLFIVRHGESEWNRVHRYQGQLDAPLSDLGLRQAEALGARLRDEPIDAIYTSPLQRASVTADAIARQHPQAPLRTDPALLEIHHGEWQGKYSDEVSALYGEGLREWREHPTRAQMPGGESFSNVLKRTLEFKELAYAAHAGQTVVASTHDVVVKILVADALGMDMDRINRIWIGNASITVIEYGDGWPFLASLSEVAHLGLLASTRESQKAL